MFGLFYYGKTGFCSVEILDRNYYFSLTIYTQVILSYFFGLILAPSSRLFSGFKKFRHRCEIGEEHR